MFPAASYAQAWIWNVRLGAFGTFQAQL